MRKLETLTNDHFQARIYRDAEWDEYRVRYDRAQDGAWVYLGDESDSHAQTHQDARDDARANLWHMLGRIGA